MDNDRQRPTAALPEVAPSAFQALSLPIRHRQRVEDDSRRMLKSKRERRQLYPGEHAPNRTISKTRESKESRRRPNAREREHLAFVFPRAQRALGVSGASIYLTSGGSCWPASCSRRAWLSKGAGGRGGGERGKSVRDVFELGVFFYFGPARSLARSGLLSLLLGHDQFSDDPTFASLVSAARRAPKDRSALTVQLDSSEAYPCPRWQTQSSS